MRVIFNIRADDFVAFARGERVPLEDAAIARQFVGPSWVLVRVEADLEEVVITREGELILGPHQEYVQRVQQ